MERSRSPDFIIPDTRRAHSPNEGPLFTARPLARARGLRADDFGERIKAVDMRGTSLSRRFSSSPLNPEERSETDRLRMLIAEVHSIRQEAQASAKRCNSRWSGLSSIRWFETGNLNSRLFQRLEADLRDRSEEVRWSATSGRADQPARRSGSTDNPKAGYPCPTSSSSPRRRPMGRRAGARGGKRSARCKWR